MCLERGVRLVLHAWASVPIVEDGAVRGVVFESKEGRQAIYADVVIDCTGDGDVFARAGEQTEEDIEQDDIHHTMNTAFLVAGVDMDVWTEFRASQPEQYSALLKRGREQLRLFERPFVSWRKDIALFMGPRQSGYSGLTVDDLSDVEIRSHRIMSAMVAFYRENGPGFENAYLVLSGPQLEVRHTRPLVGTSKITRAQWTSGAVFPSPPARP